MPKAHIDEIKTLSMKERWGVVEEVRRLAIVTGLSGVDWSVMYQALMAAGIPDRNTFLEGASHLHLVDRNVKMVDRDTAHVELVYGMYNDRGQLLEWVGEFGGGGWGQNVVAGKMQASVEQKPTNIYREGGSGPEQLIVVDHTYPPDDPDYGGRTIHQTGEVNVYIPQRSFHIEGIKYTTAPWMIANDLIGAVNAFFWMGQPPCTWMCTEVTWEPRQWPATFMSFNFQHNPDTWNPTAVFIDDRTGKPPIGLEPGIGYKYIPYHREVDFNLALGFAVMGSL